MAHKQTMVWKVKAGGFERHYATEYHAEQMARALRLNGMEVTVSPTKLPADPLTRLIAA